MLPRPAGVLLRDSLGLLETASNTGELSCDKLA